MQFAKIILILPLVALGQDRNLRKEARSKKLDTGCVCDEDCMDLYKKCAKCDLDMSGVAYCKKGKLPSDCYECCEVLDALSEDVPPYDKVCIEKNCTAKCEATATAECEVEALATCEVECGSSVPKGFAQATSDASADATSSATAIGGTASADAEAHSADAEAHAESSAHVGTASDASCGSNLGGLVLTITCPQCSCCGSCVAKATAKCYASATASCLAECKI